MPKFTIVTACRNAERYIEETVRSILTQTVFRSEKAELEYLVCDGASTDATLERLRPFEREGVRVVSEPDRGFYDALAKGLQRASGDYVAYLNAGDLLHPAGLAIAAECFELPGVKWLTGYAAVCNVQSQVTQCWLPYRYRRNLFACGAYGTFMPFLQQESTLWRRELHAAVDFRILENLRYAGDSYLWKCFASICDLHVVRGLIGSFRVHRGQISERIGDYRKELGSFSRPPSAGERAQGLVDRVLWAGPERLKSWANRSTLIRYDHTRQGWVRE